MLKAIQDRSGDAPIDVVPIDVRVAADGVACS